MRAFLPVLLVCGAAGSLAMQRSKPSRWAMTTEGAVVRFEGAALRAERPPTFAPAQFGGGLAFNTDADVWCEPSPGLVTLPSRALTVSAWVSIDAPQRWGGLVGRLEDNGGFEKGWLLGYDEERFTFALSSEGADDGDGKLTYLRGRAPYQRGRWHHVAATYDGAVMRLYVDGALDAESREQSGDVLYADFGGFVVGAYRDKDERYPHDGRIQSVVLTDAARDAAGVRALGAASSAAGEAQEGEAQEGEALEGPRLSDLPPWDDVRFDWLVRPYLTWPALDAVSVGCETTEASRVTVRYRADDEAEWRAVASAEARGLHTLRITGLSPDTKYFYQVALDSAAPTDAPREPDEPRSLESEVASFRTAASPGRPFTFVVVGDTQTQGDVARRVADLAQEHRPNLLVHAGDLVDTGSQKSEWTHYFFKHVGPLLRTIPMMPVLGNHEQDARHYYEYMDLPQPERWYSFTYGDAEFFMLDGNRSLAQQSEQLAWLAGALAASKSLWRFAVLHQPPYTSDADDYGDTRAAPSTRGDMNVRNIVALLERYDVDICFSGHVHDYERTFPIKGGEVVPYEEGGVLYVTAAGGGGRLEDFDATNTWFGHKKARRHHLVYVGIHGRHLELQAIDENGRLFDVLHLTKRETGRSR
ncbi:MAG: metallophosphoesterase [Planctomycetota bacterium]